MASMPLMRSSSQSSIPPMSCNTEIAASATPPSPKPLSSSAKRFLSRLIWPLSVSTLRAASAANACSKAEPNLGRNSSALMPDSTIFSSSAVVTPIDLAAIAIAGESRSPNWPRSSSMLTLPLPAICDKARNTPLASSADKFMAATALATPLKICWVCAWLMLRSLVAAASWA